MPQRKTRTPDTAHRHPGRLRQLPIWAGLLVTMLLTGLWAASTLTHADYLSSTYHVVCGGGGIGIIWRPVPPPDVTGLYIRSERQLPVVWLPYVGRMGTSRVIVIPLWLLIALAALPTAVLARRHGRRIPPGHCRRCGYNLTGNVSGVCPECGSSIFTDRRVERKAT